MGTMTYLRLETLNQPLMAPRLVLLYLLHIIREQRVWLPASALSVNLMM